MTEATGRSGVVRRSLIIRNERGLHARAAARFVKLAALYQAEVRVSAQGTEVSGVSIMGLLMLGAARGTRIEIEADGADAAAVIQALAALVNEGFGEDLGRS